MKSAKAPVKIPLTQGEFTIVDAEDYALLSKFHWQCWKGPWNNYAKGVVEGKNIPLHRFLLNPSRDKVVDHINGDGLDNRRSNLRIVTTSQNGMNRKLSKNNSSGYKGVCYNKQRGKWMAYIMFEKKQRTIGYFANSLEAAKAYNKEASRLFGEFAKLNDVRATSHGR